jgi:hypothetical protein
MAADLHLNGKQRSMHVKNYRSSVFGGQVSPLGDYFSKQTGGCFRRDFFRSTWELPLKSDSKRPRSCHWEGAGSDQSSLEDINARILQVLEAERWFSVRTITELFKILALTVHLHLTTSLK